MNTPTKITFSRIIAIVVMIITLVVFYFIGLFNPSFVIPNIPGTNIKKPRARDPYETDSEYVQYLEDYYNEVFGSKHFSK